MVTIQQNPAEIAASQYHNAEIQLGALEKKEQALKPNGLVVNGARVVGAAAGMSLLETFGKPMEGFIQDRNSQGIVNDVLDKIGNSGKVVDIDKLETTLNNAFKDQKLTKVVTDKFDSLVQSAGKDVKITSKDLSKALAHDKGMFEGVRNNINSAVGDTNRIVTGASSAIGQTWNNMGSLGRTGVKAGAILATAVAVGAVAKNLMSNKEEMANTAAQKEQAMQERAQAGAFLQQEAQRPGSWAERVTADRQNIAALGNGVR